MRTRLLHISLLYTHTQTLKPLLSVACAFSVLTACRKACGGAPHDATYTLDVADLLSRYGADPGVLDNRALEQACTAIMACQVSKRKGRSDTSVGTV